VPSANSGSSVSFQRATRPFTSSGSILIGVDGGTNISNPFGQNANLETAINPLNRPGRFQFICTGTGDIEIKGIELLGDDGRPTAMATTAAPLVLRLHYDAHTPIENPSFGIAIESESGVYLSALNSRLGGVETGSVVGTGFLDYTIPRLSLMAGTYLLSVGITDEHELHTFDYVHHYFELHVRAGDVDERRGFLEAGGHWSAPVSSAPGEGDR